MSGWRSDFVAAATQLGRQRDRLLGLVGRRITAGRTGWDPDRRLWFGGMPLVLGFDDGSQLELAWDKWDSLSVTWGTIDFSVVPQVVGRPHAWRASWPEPVAAVVGRTVTGFSVVENPYFSGEAMDFTKAPPMHALAGYLVSGLWIETGDTGLNVFNGMDETGLRSVPGIIGYEGVDRTTPLETFTSAA